MRLGVPPLRAAASRWGPLLRADGWVRVRLLRTVWRVRGAGRGGETCSEFTCAESLVCHAAKCMPLPAAGERCDDGACAADAYCDSADVCAPAQPLLCDVDIGTVDGQPRIDRA